MKQFWECQTIAECDQWMIDDAKREIKRLMQLIAQMSLTEVPEFEYKVKLARHKIADLEHYIREKESKGNEV